MNRKSVMAGHFYSGEDSELAREVDSLLPYQTQKLKAKGLIVPHAGYCYSGSVAGKVYSSINPPKNVVLLGPNHSGMGSDVAISGDNWETPLGTVAVNEAFIKDLIAVSDIARVDPSAHRSEHSLEVQLPFLQRISRDVSIIPIALKGISFNEIEVFSREIVALIKKKYSDTVIIASNDMSHFESREDAREKDLIALERIKAFDPEGLIGEVRDKNITMCGCVPTALMLSCIKEMGACRIKIIEHTDSGCVTGDLSSVVSYLGVVFY